MKLDATVVGKALDLAYDKAVEGVPGVPGLGSAEGLAEDYLNHPGPLEDRVDALVRVQVLKAATSGFVAGLGGLITLPVALPANLASIMYLQLQMVAAVARMGGHDVRNDRVKAVCYACLCGNAAAEVLQTAGVTIGKKLTERAIKQMSYEAIKKINQAVGFRMVTKFGQTGAINLGKALPVVGGVIGGTFDGTTTYAIGRVARSAFVTGGELLDPEQQAPEQPQEVDIVESFSRWLSAEDDGQGRDFFWGEPRERTSFWD